MSKLHQYLSSVSILESTTTYKLMCNSIQNITFCYINKVKCIALKIQQLKLNLYIRPQRFLIKIKRYD